MDKSITTVKPLKENQIMNNITAESLLGIPELETMVYNENEIKAIKLELISYMFCRNETIQEQTLNAWINEFSILQIKPFEAIQRIRIAKHEKKYGASEFSIFMNVELKSYGEFYKHIATGKKDITGLYAKPINETNGLRQGNLFKIISDNGNYFYLDISGEHKLFEKKDFEIVESIF